jgi:hypothetical protein
MLVLYHPLLHMRLRQTQSNQYHLHQILYLLTMLGLEHIMILKSPTIYQSNL